MNEPHRYTDFEIADGFYELSNGKTLKVWSQSDGQWACIAYDHGPFCRRCRHISEDESEASLVSHVIDGNMEMEDSPDGWRFRVRALGEAEVIRILARDGYTADDLKGWDKAALGRYLRGEKP